VNVPKNALFDDSENCFTPMSWDRTAYEWRAMLASPYCYNLTATQKHILVAMCWYGKKHGEDIFPSQKEISFRAGSSLTYVNATMQDAERKGWIIRDKISIYGGRARTLYHLTLPLGIFDATAMMKARFWLPPYKYEIEEQNDSVRLVPRTDLCSP